MTKEIFVVVVKDPDQETIMHYRWDQAEAMLSLVSQLGCECRVSTLNEWDTRIREERDVIPKIP